LGIRQIRKVEDSVLREKARSVKEVDELVERLLEDMVETMLDAGGIGLAAPQVGIPKQVIVADGGERGTVCLVNPRVVESWGEGTDVEGCLSIPGVYGEVPRAYGIRVEAWNGQGEEVRLEAEEMLARVLQHEIDHLNGVLFTDKVTRFIDPEEMKREE